MSNDPLIEKSHDADAEAERVAKAANLFDLRRIIGALFAVYGVILTIVGLTDSQAEIDKAAGIHINLFTGIGMLDRRGHLHRVGDVPPAQRRARGAVRQGGGRRGRGPPRWPRGAGRLRAVAAPAPSRRSRRRPSGRRRLRRP